MITKKSASGFESIALVQDFEETFGIKFKNEELAKETFTVGQIYDLVISKLPFKQAKSSLKKSIFLEIKTELSTKRGVGEVRPSTELRLLIPNQKRQLEREGLLHLFPEIQHLLRHTNWCRFVITTVTLSSFYVGWYFKWYWGGVPILASFVLNIALRYFDVIEPKANIRDLVNLRAELEFIKRSSLSGFYNPKEVWEIVTTILARHLSGNPKEMTAETRLVEDLGLRD